MGALTCPIQVRISVGIVVRRLELEIGDYSGPEPEVLGHTERSAQPPLNAGVAAIQDSLSTLLCPKIDRVGIPTECSVPDPYLSLPAATWP